MFIQEKVRNIYQTTFEYASPSESSFLSGIRCILSERQTAYYIPYLIKEALLTVTPVSARPFSGALLIVGGALLLIVLIAIGLMRSLR